MELIENFKSLNGKLACEPFEDMAVKKSLEGTGAVKVVRIESKTSLTALTVLAENDKDVQPGWKVLLRADLFTMPWAKEIHTHRGIKYILVPFDRVEAVVL